MKTIVLTVKDTAVDHVLAVLKRQLSADEVVIHPPTAVENPVLPQSESRASTLDNIEKGNIEEVKQGQNDTLDRQASFLAWRRELEAQLTDEDHEAWEDPWANVRSKEMGRDFSWDE
jgi:4-alpha-glucanotransferase